MDERKDFFSDKQKTLLKTADTAKTLSGIVLGVFILWAVLQVFQYQNTINIYSPTKLNVFDFLRNNPLEAFRLVVNMLTIALRGVVYYLVLKGLSLGLNMVVETDVNYRGKGEFQNEQ